MVRARRHDGLRQQPAAPRAGCRQGPARNDLAGELAARAERKGDLAWWTTDRDPLLTDVVDTSVEATAFAVQALAARDPRHPLLEPAVRWLLLNRTFGVYWASTKQTAMVLMGCSTS